MTEEDAETLANNAPHGLSPVIVDSNESLLERHNPGSNNPQVVSRIIQFVTRFLK